MPLGQREKATFVSVKDGRLVTKTISGEEQTYEYLSGRLVNLTSTKKEFHGEPVTQFLFEFKDDEGERYILSTGEKSGVARSILNALASIEDAAGEIRVIPYFKDGFSKVMIYHNGGRLDWKYKELPPLEEKTVGGAMVKDDTKRTAFFQEIAEEVRQKVTSVNRVN